MELEVFDGLMDMRPEENRYRRKPGTKWIDVPLRTLSSA